MRNLIGIILGVGLFLLISVASCSNNSAEQYKQRDVINDSVDKLIPTDATPTLTTSYKTKGSGHTMKVYRIKVDGQYYLISSSVDGVAMVKHEPKDTVK